VSYTAYQAAQASYDSVFIATITAAVDSPPSSVKNLIVSDVSRRRTSATASTDFAVAAHLRMTHGARHIVLADAVGMQYTVEVPASSGVTYDQMSSTLATSVASGQFTSLLEETATAQDVPALTTASSSSVQTQDTTPSDLNTGSGDDTTISVGAVVGIAVGGFAALVIGACLCFCLCKRHTAGARDVQNLDTLHSHGKHVVSCQSVLSPCNVLHFTTQPQVTRQRPVPRSPQVLTRSVPNTRAGAQLTTTSALLKISRTPCRARTPPLRLWVAARCCKES